MENEQTDFVEVQTGIGGAKVKKPRVQRIRYFNGHWCNYTRGQEHIVLFHHWLLRMFLLKEFSKEKDLRAEVAKKYPELAGDDAAWNEAIENLSSRGMLVRELGRPDIKDPDARRIPTGRLLLTGNGAVYGAMSPNQLGLEG
jgi:hypothetical protein